MPRLTRTFIKTGFLYLLFAFILDVLIAAQPVLELPDSIAVLRPVQIHVFVVGWLTQLIVGVMFWMFPKFSKEQPRGNVRLGWAAYGLLNAGLLLRAIGEPLPAFAPAIQAGWLLVLSAILQCTAGWCVIANTWPRVKER